MSKHWELRDGTVYAFSKPVYEDFKRHGCRVELVEEAEPIVEGPKADGPDENANDGTPLLHKR